MKAAVVNGPLASRPVEVRELPEPKPRPHWVTVRLRHAALNRLDAMQLATRSDDDAGAVFGSDGAGEVTQAGEALAAEPGLSPGSSALILPSLFWGPRADAPGPRYEILGSPTHGTHAQYVTVPAANIYPKPAHLSWREAAALPMAGLTAWRSLMTRGRLQPGETVIVGAASSGVGSLAIQIAVASGARVIAITSTDDKAARALELGAAAVVDRTAADLADELRRAIAGIGSGEADLALDPTGALWQPFVDVLRPGGRLVAVGRMAAAEARLRVQSVYWKQVDLLGSTMGSPTDFAAFLDHVILTGWAPVVDSAFELEDIDAAYARLDHPDRVGKVVLDVA